MAAFHKKEKATEAKAETTVSRLILIAGRNCGEELRRIAGNNYG